MSGVLLRFPAPKPAASGRGKMEPVTLLRPHQRLAWQCLSFPEILNEWEAGFVTSIREKRNLSDRELTCLQAIAAKVERARR